MKGNKLKHRFVEDDTSVIDRILNGFRNTQPMMIPIRSEDFIEVKEEKQVSQEMILRYRLDIDSLRGTLKREMALNMVNRLIDEDLIGYEEFYNPINNMTQMRMSLEIKKNDINVR